MLEATPPPHSNLDTIVSNAFGEHYLFAINQNAFQKNNAGSVFRAHFGDSLFQENMFYVVVGTDSGLLYQYVKTQGAPKGSRYLFVELPQILERLVEMNDPNGHVATTTLEKWLDYANEKMNMFDWTIQDRVTLVSSLGVIHGHYPEYLTLLKKVREELDLLLENYRMGSNHCPFMVSQLQNLAENQVPAIHLQNRFQGKTAVVLAGGPSLNELLPWVREHRKNLLVIAVSRISYALLKAGIQPDISVSVDPYPFNMYVCREMLEFQEGTLLVNEYHLSSNLLSSWGGLKVFTGLRYPWPTPSEPENLHSNGGTVTNTAFSIALETGVSQIILGGADFCFSETGQTHAAGSAEHALGSQPMYGDRRVVTNGGLMADTDRVFMSSARAIDAQAAQAMTRGCRVINPAPGSMRLPNVEHIPLNTIEIASLEKSAREIIAASIPKEDSASRLRYYKEVVQEISRAQKELRAVRELAVKALDYNEKLFGPGEKRNLFHFNAKLDDVEKQLKTKYAGIVKFVQLFGLRRLAPLLRQTDLRADDIRKHNELYFQAITDLSDELLKLVSAARTRIISRQEEEKLQPNIDLLINQWQLDRTPGRAVNWAKLHADVVNRLPEEQQQKLHEFQNTFEESIKALAPEYYNSIEQGITLRGLNARAREYFRCGEVGGLQSLLTGLHEHRDQENAMLFVPLIQGYLAELQGQTKSAIEIYRKIDKGPAQADALMRMFELHVKANDLNAALDNLQTLSDINAAYSPMYADMLESVGDVARAVEIYTDYLLANPNDLNSVMKLGKIYHKYEAPEGVEWAMNYILGMDPGNQAAKAMLNSLEQTRI